MRAVPASLLVLLLAACSEDLTAGDGGAIDAGPSGMDSAVEPRDAGDAADSAEDAGPPDAPPDQPCDTPGATESVPCGRCGTVDRFCSAARVWVYGVCAGEGECAPGSEETMACGDCGTQLARCTTACVWEPQGACAGEGECTPGATMRTSDGCPAGQTREALCSASCAYEASGSCEADGCAMPGITEDVACGHCGTMERFCTSERVWQYGPCEGEGVCAPGTLEHRPCGDCGTQPARCTAACAWESTGACAGEGECAPGARVQSGDGCVPPATREVVCSAACAFEPAGACMADLCLTPGETQTVPCGPICGTRQRFCTTAGVWMDGPCSAICDASSHTLCQSFDCAGTRYYCTGAGGTWAWRTEGACDDGNACTSGDVCSAGACAGAAVICTSTTCMTRTCNGTASCTETPNVGVSCSDGDLCTYADACDGSGVCRAGSTVTCADTACLDRSCNGTAMCAETVRAGAACDDGNACTFGETCGAAGACGSGTAISCSGMDTPCATYACDGTASCALTPRNVGLLCDDGDGTTLDDRCRTSGLCVGGCGLPADACASGTQSRDGCGAARVIGRSQARTTAGYVATANTCGGPNRFDDCSWDAGPDHSYRIWLRAGEQIMVRVHTMSSTGCGGPWSATLKLYESDGCGAAPSCGVDVWCEDHVGTAPQTYTAPRDGWVVIVVDGSTSFDDEGAYTLTVWLTSCAFPGCDC